MKTERTILAFVAMHTMMEAFPAEMRQVAPGQFQTLPGPRFEPNRNVKRAEFLNPASRLINLMFGE
jgi:hypothetical protein